ncbi:MAG: hypothetical protein JO097_02930 [Acidobacteriaceae bacterium]|nr:hypothetical protein [Acidobacteriaceae bacterium]MBV9295786.1 hypothetical protein [Acidobacteriaceae bacterium]MBV9766145.1 hypothetical protein [Acidobacteriaceae bacterium]
MALDRPSEVPAAKLGAVRNLLELMIDEYSNTLSPFEAKAVAQAEEWLKHNEPIPHEQVLAELGVSPEDWERMCNEPLPIPGPIDTLERRELPMLSDKQHALELLDQLGPGQLAAVVHLLEVIVQEEPEPVTEEDRRRFHEGQAWFASRGGKGIPMEDVLADFGLKPEDFPLK